MNKLEHFRLTEALKNAGWTDEEISNFILWIKTGNEQYKPENNQ